LTVIASPSIANLPFRFNILQEQVASPQTLRLTVIALPPQANLGSIPLPGPRRIAISVDRSNS
jgi:hypothetical protein